MNLRLKEKEAVLCFSRRPPTTYLHSSFKVFMFSLSIVATPFRVYHFSLLVVPSYHSTSPYSFFFFFAIFIQCASVFLALCHIVSSMVDSSFHFISLLFHFFFLFHHVLYICLLQVTFFALLSMVFCLV
jgi:hypothetical protein